MTRPTQVQAMQIVPGDLEAQYAAFKWVESEIGSFSPREVFDQRLRAPKFGVGIDSANGRFILSNKGKLRWGNDGDWIVKKENGEFVFCPPNLFNGNYEKI